MSGKLNLARKGKGTAVRKKRNNSHKLETEGRFLRKKQESQNPLPKKITAEIDLAGLALALLLAVFLFPVLLK